MLVYEYAQIVKRLDYFGLLMMNLWMVGVMRLLQIGMGWTSTRCILLALFVLVTNITLHARR